MRNRLFLLLALLIAITFVGGTTYQVVLAQEGTGTGDEAIVEATWGEPNLQRVEHPQSRASANEAQPPPLSGGCSTVGLPIDDDFNHIICCVSGYVYFNGRPTDKATVTITALKDGQSVEAQMLVSPDTGLHYYSAQLHKAPLNIEPGDAVMVTAKLNELSKTTQFIAAPSGQQIDVVLPQSEVNATWETTMLAGRKQHAMAYDSGRDRVVMFGGLGNNGALGDTWEWDGEQWHSYNTTNAPTPRYGHAMVYDEARQVTLLVGGISGNGQRLNDTWAWNGHKWSQYDTGNDAPYFVHHPAYLSHVTYASHLEQVILFTPQKLFTWNGSTWTTLYYSSDLPWYATISYDSVTKKVLIFSIEGMWEWSEAGLIKQEYWSGPYLSRYYNYQLYYDVKRQKTRLVVMIPNWSSLWEWSGESWKQILSRYQMPSWPSTDYSYQDAAFTYNETAGELLLFGGYTRSTISVTNDTWTLNQEDVWEHKQRLFTPPNIQFLGYALNEDLLAFSNAGHTYRQQHLQWITNTVATSTVNLSLNMQASDEHSQRILLFGGGTEPIYSNQTVFWDGNAWHEIITPTAVLDNAPSPRTEGSLTYDAARDVWVLFGGHGSVEDGRFDDTWTFDGAQWEQQFPQGDVTPPPLSGHSAFYDPFHERVVLFGGSTSNGANQLYWFWDGASWSSASDLSGSKIPETFKNARVVHDTARHTLVFLQDDKDFAVEWNGTYTQERKLQYKLTQLGPIVYDKDNDAIWTYVNENLYKHTVLGQPKEAPPIATIVRTVPANGNVRRGHDTIRLEGRGADADTTDTIVAYRWSHYGYGNDPLGESAILELPASELPLGLQTISLQVQDDEGKWSEPVHRKIMVRDSQGGTGNEKTWTLLIYAVADNNLDAFMGESEVFDGMLARLKDLPPRPNVQIGIWYDGNRYQDSRQIIIRPDGTWEETSFRTEIQMDKMETLRDFVDWGYDTFDSDYYSLSLVDHANGVVGFGQDKTSNSTGQAFLTPREIRIALQQALSDETKTLDVLHYDGCSFGLFEDASIGHGLVEFTVASPSTGWGIFAYDLYRQNAHESSTPREYALKVAQQYAEGLDPQNVPYTISVFDMAQFEPLKDAIGQFGDDLLNYVQQDSDHKSQIRRIRDETQKYDSGGLQEIALDVEDSYLDIGHFAQSVGHIGELSDTAQDVITQIGHFVIYSKHRSNDNFFHDGIEYQIDLENSYGLGIFYPPRRPTEAGAIFLNYINNQLFDLTYDWGWSRFLARGLPPQLGSDPDPLPNDYLLPPLEFRFDDTSQGFGQCVERTGPENAHLYIPRWVSVDDIQLTRDDEIAVYSADGQLCVGHGIWAGQDLYLTIWGDNPLTPSKDGLDAGEAFQIHLWDASTSRKYTRIAPTFSQGSGNYVENSVYMISMLELDPPLTTELILNPGWNTVASHLDPGQDIGTVLSAVEDQLTVAKNGTGGLYWPGHVDQIKAWAVEQGYMIRAESPITITVSGQPVVPERNPIKLNHGWNLVAYLRTDPMSIEQALTTILEDVVMVTHEGRTFVPDSASNTLQVMEPNKGYWIYLDKAATLTFPKNAIGRAGSSALRNAPLVDTTHFNQCASNTGSRAILTVPRGTQFTDSVSNTFIELQNGDELAVYAADGSLCGGALVWDTASRSQSMVVWANDTWSNEIDGLESNDEMQFRIWQRATNTEFIVTATFESETPYHGDNTFAASRLYRLHAPSVPTAVGIASHQIISERPQETLVIFISLIMLTSVTLVRSRRGKSMHNSTD